MGLEKDFLVGVRLEKGDPGEKVWDEKRFSEAKIIKKLHKSVIIIAQELHK